MTSSDRSNGSEATTGDPTRHRELEVAPKLEVLGPVTELADGLRDLFRRSYASNGG